MAEKRTPVPPFIRLHLSTRLVALGERIKRGSFRPCIETLPTSALIGCFHEHFGFQETVAIGFFRAGGYRRNIFTYAPLDSCLKTARLPLTLEHLVPALGHQEIEADVYVAATREAKAVFTMSQGPWAVTLGAMRSKGFGQCLIRYIEEVTPARLTGFLRGYLRESDAPMFGIDLPRDLISPRYCYLFRPDMHRVGGRYERALFSGTILRGPDFLMGEEYTYDR